MTFQEALKKEKRWQKRAFLVNLYHNLRLLKHRKWTMRATARRLGISLGAVSEAVKLAEAMIDKPEIENMKRDEALKFIK